MSETAPFGADISDENEAQVESRDFISSLDDDLNLNHYNLLLAQLETARVAQAEVLADSTAPLGAKAESSVREQEARIAVAAYQRFHDVRSSG